MRFCTIPCNCFLLGVPSVSGFASISYLSVSAQGGRPISCFSCTPYEKASNLLNEILVVLKRVPLNTSMKRCSSGLVGLMVETSMPGDAFAAIGGIFGDGGGIVHSVSGVARVKISGRGPGPWLQVPVIVLPSGLSLPS